MAQLRVTLIETLHDRRLTLRLPDDVPLAQLVPTLARKLELSEGEYELIFVATGAPLPAEATLTGAGVTKGQELRLRARPAASLESLVASVQDYVARGLAYVEEEDYAQAWGEFTKAIELDPHNAEAYLSRGEVHEELDLGQRAVDDYTQALFELTRVIERDPHNAETYVKRGKVFHQLYLHNQAIADYTKAAEIEPGPEVYHRRAFAHLGMKQWQAFVDDYMKVIECRTQAIEREPGCAQAYCERAEAYRMLVRMRYSRPGWDSRRGRRDIRSWTEQTLPDYDRVLELEPDHREVLGYRFAAYCALDRGQQALADANRMLELWLDDPGGYFARFRAHRGLGQLQQALADLDRVIELDPHYYLVYDYRSDVYERLGRRQEADADRKRQQEEAELEAEVWEKDWEVEKERRAQVRERITGSVPDIPSLRAKVTELVFFERPGDRIPEKPAYSHSFARRKTRHVAWALSLEHPAPGRRMDFAIRAVYHRADGSILADQTLRTYLLADWTTSRHSDSWGWSQPGQWPVGAYRVDLHVEDTNIATGWFEVY